MSESKKVNQSSIRYSNQVKDIIESFEGNSFSDKLENIILYSFAEKEKLKVELEFQKNLLNNIKKEILSLRTFKSKLYEINNLAYKLHEQITMSIDEDELFD